MAVKLYRRDGDRLNYWEAWERGGRATFHFGEVGQRGNTDRVAPPTGQTVAALIEAGTADARTRGYEPFPRDRMRRIILSCPVGPDWTADDRLGVARYLEALCNESLGWTGLGHCDGPVYSRGTIGVYSLVVDEPLGIREIVAELRRHGCEGKEEELVVSVPDGTGFRVVYTTGTPANEPRTQ